MARSAAHRRFTRMCYDAGMIGANSIRLAAFAALAATAAAPLAAQSTERGEERLAEVLEGRVAGEPVECLRESQRDGIQVVTGAAFVFRDGDTLWVNRPSGAQTLSLNDIPAFQQYGTNLCRLDRVELYSRSGGIPGPILILDDFVPYTKAGGDESQEEGG